MNSFILGLVSKLKLTGIKLQNNFENLSMKHTSSNLFWGLILLINVLKSARTSPGMSDLVLTPLITPTALVHGLSETYFGALSVHHFLLKTWLSVYQFLPKQWKKTSFLSKTYSSAKLSLFWFGSRYVQNRSQAWPLPGINILSIYPFIQTNTRNPTWLNK